MKPLLIKNKSKIRLASNEEIASLSGVIPDDVEVKDHLICFRLLKFDSPTESYYMALAFNDFDPYIATEIETISVSEGLIRTKSGIIYSVEEINQKEPPESLLRYLKDSI